MDYVSQRADVFAKRFVDKHKAAMKASTPKEKVPLPQNDVGKAAHSRLNKLRAARKNT